MNPLDKPNVVNALRRNLIDVSLFTHRYQEHDNQWVLYSNQSKRGYRAKDNGVTIELSFWNPRKPEYNHIAKLATYITPS